MEDVSFLFNQDLLELLGVISKTSSSVLIIGEVGCAQRIFARKIHENSKRHEKPFIIADCAALTEDTFEEYLFQESGCFEKARGGTIFLDNVENMPLKAQGKIFSDFYASPNFDVRIIASTSKNLEARINEGKFRKDFYYRLNVISVRLLPLRRRKNEIEKLATKILEAVSFNKEKKFEGFSSNALKALKSYYWPGNLFELWNVVESACVLGKPPYITEKNLKIAKKSDWENKNSTEISFMIEEDAPLKSAINQFKKSYVLSVLHKTNWNQTKAAKALGIQRTYLSKLLLDLNIRDEM